MEVRHASLATADLTATNARRDLPPDFMAHGEDIDTRYDRTTLWYDAIWTGRRLSVVCPTPFNLAPYLARGLRLDGIPVEASNVERRDNHVVFNFGLRERPARLSADIGGTEISTGVSDAADGAFFRGLNTVLILQKDNPPLWIRDFIRWHREKHGLQAALFLDNGSTQYTPDEILDALSDGGLERAMFVSVPLRYGPRGQTAAGQKNWSGLFLQNALLNIARIRFLAQARAVLQCDIDEMVWSRDGTSVFDLAHRHPLGVVKIGLEWRYANIDDGRLPRHADHVWRRVAPAPCPPKYCLRPSSLLAGASWRVHGLGVRGFGRLFPLSKRVGAWHLRQITTSWKPYADRLSLPADLVPDEAASRELAGFDFH